MTPYSPRDASPRLVRRAAAWLRRAVPWTAMVLLAGCSVLPKSETLTTYTLPQAAAPTGSAAVPALSAETLRVAEPRASRLVSSLRILVRPTGSELSAYQGVRWSDPAPTLLRDRLVEQLRDLQVFGAVTGDADLPAPLVLGGDLTAFEAVYREPGAAPTVHVRLEATLVQSRNRRIVATQRFEARVPARTVEVEDVVEAFGQATQQLSTSVSAWTVAQADQWVRAEQPGRAARGR